MVNTKYYNDDDDGDEDKVMMSMVWMYWGGA